MEFTFLSNSQVFGKYKLHLLKKCGVKCCSTDFAIILGEYSAGISFFNSDTHQKSCVGDWWTKTSNCSAATVVRADIKDWCHPYSKTVGARPVTCYSLISKDVKNVCKLYDDIYEVEYGEYPQSIVSVELSNCLEYIYNCNNLCESGKCYTINGYDVYNIDNFCCKEVKEYVFNGDKYVRLISNASSNKRTLSDGRMIFNNSVLWVKVERVKWLVDTRKDIALSKNILFSGICFNGDKSYNGDFENTDIYKYMNSYFSKDIGFRNVNGLVDGVKYNPYGFNFDKVSEEEIIRGFIDSGVAVFLHGKSSDGKSARIKQIDPGCVIIYLRNASLDSINGKSVYNVDSGEMIDIKPTWLKKLEERCNNEPDKYHIVFFDEITNALPSIQGCVFNIILDREVNGLWKLPDNARIVAAGNDINDSLAANQIAEPLFNRFAHVYIETTVDSWLKWASDNNIHPAIYAFIAYKKDKVLRSEYNGEKPNADPRKWEMASKVLYKTGRPEMLRALVGEDITQEFIYFCNQRVITLDDVLNDNYSEKDLQMNISEMYATCVALSSVDEVNFKKVHNFVLRLGAEFCSLFELLWVHGDDKRLEMVYEMRLSNQKEAKKVYERK